MLRSAGSARRDAGAPRRLPLLVLAVSLVVAVVAFPARGRGQDAPLAEGDAQVIAQGLTAPPAEEVAWRVVSQEIPVRADARPSNRMPSAAGFVLANDGSVFISDQDTKRRYRLAPGEAEFVPTGANQTWASLADTAGSVYAIELTDAAVLEDEAAGEVLVVGSGFAMPQGDYDLNLIRDVVDSGETATLAAGEFPVLVFATEGALDVGSSESEEAARLGRGEGLVLGGDISIRGRGDDRSTYVAAVIGDAVTGGSANATSVPPEETPEPEPTDEPDEAEEADPTETVEPEGETEPTEEPTATDEPEPTATEEPEPEEATPEGSTLRIAIRLCRDGITVANLNPRACQRADGNYRLALVTPDGTRLRLKDAAKVDKSFIRWSGLEAGEYALIIGDLPRGYISYSLDGFTCCPFPNGYPISIPEDTVIEGTLYLLQDVPARRSRAPVAAARSAATAVPAPVETGDSDSDGVTDADELDIFGTSPRSVDSDGDTIPDGVEAYGGNGYRTKPAKPDSDGDGVDDNVEIARGTSPTNPASS